ncbi:MAG: hypothetical protein HIU86_01865 [Acidobacteria bacterium]|nr:hypothetical protein [Acidobacteriota bacterium]
MSESIHEWDGAYVLGALEPAERRRYEEHLSECSTCSRSVRELAGVPGILGVLDQEEALALRDLPDDASVRAGAHVPDRAAGVARRVRLHRRRIRVTSALVLVVVLAIGSIGGWSVLHALQTAARSVTASRTLRPVDGSHLSAHLTLTPVGWGTRLDWSCDYAAAAATKRSSYATASYSLVVHTDTGTTTTVATWTSDEGEAKGLVAATAIPADAIASIDIRLTGSSTPLAETAF